MSKVRRVLLLLFAFLPAVSRKVFDQMTERNRFLYLGRSVCVSSNKSRNEVGKFCFRYFESSNQNLDWTNYFYWLICRRELNLRTLFTLELQKREKISVTDRRIKPTIVSEFIVRYACPTL